MPGGLKQCSAQNKFLEFSEMFRMERQHGRQGDVLQRTDGCDPRGREERSECRGFNESNSGKQSDQSKRKSGRQPGTRGPRKSAQKQQLTEWCQEESKQSAGGPVGAWWKSREMGKRTRKLRAENGKRGAERASDQQR